MDQNFQTSFIPKKPIVEERRPVKPSMSIGIFTLAAILIFFTILIGSIGLYLYKVSQENKLVEMQKSLNLAKNRFEPSKIAILKTLDKRLNAGAEVLSNHVAVTPIFQALEDITMKSIRYTKFTYTYTDSKKVEVKMSGQAIGYRAVALQADLFSKNKYFIDPVFSNLNLDNKGNVIFDLTFSVVPSFVNYEQKIKTENEGNTDNLSSENNVDMNTNPQTQL